MMRFTQFVLIILLLPLLVSAQFQFAEVLPADSSNPYEIPRALAFSADGLTANTGSFNNAAPAIPKFTASAPIDETPRPDPDGFDVPIWSIAAGEVDWFANDHSARGLAYNPATGNVLVVSRTGGLSVQILDANTGSVVGQLNTNDIMGGIFPLSMIDVSPDGRIYAANLVGDGVNDPFRVYTWENESSNPTLLTSLTFPEEEGIIQRFGDSFRVDFTDNGSYIFVGGSFNPTLLKITLGQDKSTVDAVDRFSFLGSDVVAIRGIAPISGQDSLWINIIDGNVRKISRQNGEVGTIIPADVFPTKASATIDVAEFNGRVYAVVFPIHDLRANQRAFLLNFESGSFIDATKVGVNSNVNRVGSTIFDAANNRMFLLATNNHISAYDVSKYVTELAQPTSVDITFTVNTATIPDTVRAGDLVQIRGSVNGQVGDYFGTTINWGSNSVALENVGGDYWRTTLTMLPGDQLMYKIYTAKQGVNGFVSHAGGGWETDNPDPISGNYIFEVPANATDNIELPVIYFNRIPPYEAKPDSIALFFRVNVGNQVAIGALNPATDVVGVRGNPVFDWGSTLLLLEPETMPEGSRNAMYSGTIWVPNSMAGDTFKFKFVFGREDNINTGTISWDNGDDAVNPDGDGNNQVVVGRADTTYAFKFFRGRLPMADIVTASVQFAVNVGVLEELGIFNRNLGDKVSVPGGFNDWDISSTMDYNEALNAWTAAYPITEEVGARIAYKYFIQWDPSRADANSPNYMPNRFSGWEESGLFGGGNRIYILSDESNQIVDDFDRGISFFDGVPPQGVIRQTIDGKKEMNVRFLVDMEPALSHTTPFNPVSDNLYLVIETPVFGFTQGIPGDILPILNQPEWLKKIEMTRLEGPGYMYEMVLPIKLPNENHIGFRLAYVKSGTDGELVINGGGFSAGRRYYRYIQPLDTTDPNNILWPSSAELNPITWKATDLDFEMPPDYFSGDIVMPPPAGDAFTAALQVADAGTSSFTLYFGTKASATAGFDSDLDQLAPPPPPDGAFDARIVRDGDAYFTDIQPLTESTTEWLVRFRPATGASPITLSWDPTQLPSTGSVAMRDNIDGSFVQVDMRAQSEFVIPQAFITEVVVSHSLSQQVNLSLSSGWNLVGLPVEVTHTNYAELFTGALAQTLFGFAQSYQQAATMTPGQGYWVRYSAVADETLSGLPISKVDVDLAAGWNLISGPTGTTAIADVSDPQGVILPGTLFGFAQSYQQKSELEPGRGYWIRASAAGSISIGGNQAVAREVTGAPLADLGSFDRFEIVQGASATGEDLNHSQEEVVSRLYFGGELPEDLHELAYTMPPAAPGHSLDARFADDRWVSGSLVAEVVLSGTTDVLWMRVMPAGYEGESGDGVDAAAASTISPGNKGVYLLTAWSGEIVTDTQQVIGGALVQLTPGTDRVVVESLDGSELSPEVPAEFALEQNFPNPFNPSTTIRYALPEAAQVRLEVYTVTGQRVAVLASGEQSAGWHTATFDGSSLASGVYIYRLEAGGFVQTRKLMLIK
jgi:WD40 repeat protein